MRFSTGSVRIKNNDEWLDMVSTRAALNGASSNLYESIGIRDSLDPPPILSPLPSARDIGRRPLKHFGRVEVDKVMPDPSQPRSDFAKDAIDRLAVSIRKKGQIHPIRVRFDDTQSKWIIISGERRWRATKQAGLKHIECYFHEGKISEADILEQQLVENLLREDLRPIEEARAFSSLMTLHGWNGKQVAKALHLSESKVSRSLALLDLPRDIQEKVNAGDLAPRAAYEISKVPNDETKRGLTQQASSGKLTHTQAVAAAAQTPRKVSVKGTLNPTGLLRRRQLARHRDLPQERRLSCDGALTDSGSRGSPSLHRPGS